MNNFLMAGHSLHIPSTFPRINYTLVVAFDSQEKNLLLLVIVNQMPTR